MKSIFCILSLAAASLTFAAAPPQHLIVAVAPDLPEPVRREVAKTVGEALIRSPAGTQITLVQADPPSSVADVRVPEGSLVLRQQLVGSSIARFNALMKAATNSAKLWVLPRLIDEAGRNWIGPNDVLVLVGPALHADPRRPNFNFTTNWPSDGHLLADPQRSPFSTVERRHLLEGVRVFWVVTDASKTVSDDQTLAVRRFWALYFALQGGVLVNYSSDVGSVFANASSGRSNPMLTAAIDPKDTNVVMRPEPPQLPVLRVPEQEPRVAVIPENTRTKIDTHTKIVEPLKVPDFPKPPPGKVVVGAVWWPSRGESMNVDFDIYVRVPRDRVELSFQRTNSPSGRYFRDIRHAQGTTTGDWKASWEAVELDGDELPSEMWINLYSGRGPAQGELRVLRKGREHRIAFTFPAVNGNRGVDASRRERSEHWIRIDLQPIAREP